jgi:hypothetical protein
VSPDNLKLAIFAGAIAGLPLPGRRLSGTAPQDPADQYLPPADLEPEPDDDSELPPAAVGADVGLPLRVAQMIREMPEDERPKILNYYFEQIDLKTGPAEPADFLDRVFVQIETDDGKPFTSPAVVVTTPTALARLLREPRRTGIYAASYIIVDRFDMAAILGAWVTHEGTEADRDDPTQCSTDGTLV